jgi:hypothetical protein
MPAEFDAGNGSVNIALADYLTANKDSILSDWRTRVLSDSDIGTARSVNTAALTHRLPFLLDGLNETLRHFRSGAVVEEESRTLRNHGTSAWQQGYQLSEVMRELKHFRALLIYHLRLFEDIYQDFGMAAILFVASVSHAFLDDLVINITDEFLSAQLDVNEEKWRRRVRRSGDTSSAEGP